jgi:hypothetical protein
MTETAPLLFRKHLGALRPANPAAERALAAIEGNSPVRVEIKQTRGNAGRMALYWIVLSKAAEALSEVVDGDALDDTMLHQVLKDRRGLYTTTTLPSGEVLKNYRSISFAKMTENERAEYVDWAFRTLAKWIGCTVEELTTEG